MSKGPGRIERAIAEAFERRPNDSLDIGELAAICYHGVTIEKKHRVAVARAVAKVATRMGWKNNPGVGFYNPRSWGEPTVNLRERLMEQARRRSERSKTGWASRRLAKGASAKEEGLPSSSPVGATVALPKPIQHVVSDEAAGLVKQLKDENARLKRELATALKHPARGAKAVAKQRR
jgi:hypothetical protein